MEDTLSGGGTTECKAASRRLLTVRQQKITLEMNEKLQQCKEEATPCLTNEPSNLRLIFVCLTLLCDPAPNMMIRPGDLKGSADINDGSVSVG